MKNTLSTIAYLLISGCIAVVAYIILITQMWQVWLHPTPAENDVVLSFAILIAFEFILVHSGIFMASFRDHKTLLFFIVFYGLFALGFNAIMPNNLVLYIYGLVVFNRMSFVFTETNRHTLQQAKLSSFISATIYILSIGIVMVGQDFIPDFGLNPEYLRESGYLSSLKVTGEFPENPKIALAAACLYFACLSIWEIIRCYLGIKAVKVGDKSYSWK